MGHELQTTDGAFETPWEEVSTIGGIEGRKKLYKKRKDEVKHQQDGWVKLDGSCKKRAGGASYNL